MAITKLPVNFKDDVIDTTVSDKRRYNIIDNTDGTKSLEDVTVYMQIGSNFGAEQINQINGKVNELIDAIPNEFLLINQAVINFTNNIAYISDDRITANSLADVYFTADTILAAEKAVISVNTYTGRVELTAERQPDSEIKASIYIKVV